MAVMPAVKSSWNAWVEIDRHAIARNTAAVTGFVGAGVKVMAILKADGYGHGAVTTARAALAGGAAWLGVANAAEGAHLRAAGITAPVLVLGCGIPDQAPVVIEHRLAQTLATVDMAQALSAAAVAAGREIAVHLKIDTGMGRQGVWAHEALAFAQLVARLPGLRIEGVYSHLATADDDDQSYARAQAETFQRVLTELERHDIRPGLRHLANSAAIVRFPEMWLDMVRAGLLTYGLDPLTPAPDQTRSTSAPVSSTAAPLDLIPALSWKTRVACVKEAPAGQRLSYSGLYCTPGPTRIAVVPVGYADGFPRALSNRGNVLIGGRRCPVVGAVCMDQMLVDLGTAEAKVGDEVVLIGEQLGERISANDIALAQDTVVHEIVARLGKRLPRIFVDEDQP